VREVNYLSSISHAQKSGYRQN